MSVRIVYVDVISVVIIIINNSFFFFFILVIVLIVPISFSISIFYVTVIFVDINLLRDSPEKVPPAEVPGPAPAPPSLGLGIPGS